MPNWCSNSIAFYQKDKGNAILEAFYTDVQKYQGYRDHETGEVSDWVGHWLKSSRVDTENLYTRGFFTMCELCTDHVRIDMESAWGPLTEVWDLMAEKYNLDYVYISEEPGCSVYINTDFEGKFFSTRYILNYFEMDYLELPPSILAIYGERLTEISGETQYFDSWDEVVEMFEPFGFKVDDLDTLNNQLDILSLHIHEYTCE